MVGVTMFFLAISSGLGTHNRYLDAHEIQRVLKYLFFCGLLYAVATAAIKASICLLLLRLTIHRKRYTWILHGIIIFTVVNTLATMVVTLTTCKPVATNWDSSKGHCDNQVAQQKVQYGYGAGCIATDLACAILPVCILWNVQLSRKTKMYIAGMLALGVLYVSVRRLLVLR
jgi:hypothetical protein